MVTKKTKQKKIFDRGRLYIMATFNNTLITITNEKGDPAILGSCGMFGFSGTRKSTPYAATVVVKATIKRAMTEHGLKEVEVYVKGIGPGREASLREIRASGLEVEKIVDITPSPHNGVRPPKIRRG